MGKTDPLVWVAKSPEVHIHAPEPTEARKIRRRCPTCEARRTHVAFFYEWYGWDVTCLGCGDSWQDGEMRERPFEPRWRANSIAAVRSRWRVVRAKLVEVEGE